MRNVYYAHKGQLLTTHLSNVARLVKFYSKDFGAENIGFLVGQLHDFGKYTKVFQDYLKKSINGKKVVRGKVIHALQGAKFAVEIIKDALVSDIIANIIATHHNGLYDTISDGKRTLLLKISKGEDALHYTEAKGAFWVENEILLPKDISKLYDEILNVGKISQSKKLNPLFMLHLFTKVIYSCLIDADRYDSAGFDIDKEIKRGIPIWDKYSQRLNEYLEKQMFNTADNINKIRKSISNQCDWAGKRDRGIYTLPVPTGGGKTLSSLRFALKHAQKQQLDHIIYVIPYLSILDQTAKNIHDALAGSDTDEFILEHHSNIEIPESDDDDEEYKLLTSRWDSPIILTTMVQFLETIYSNKASRLRKFHNMANSIIIFDEIQALPVKCVHLFNDAVNFLHLFGKSTILLCTATQPRLNKVERPMLLSENQNIVSLSGKEEKCFERISIIDKTKTEMTFDELAEFTKEQLQQEKSTLLICNTKTQAKELFKRCKDFKESENFFLSTNICPAHRLDILDKLRISLIPETRKLTLCISTQLIEAGVDISFDCVIRVIAGLDSIIQAAGRCNRNGEKTNPQEVYVVTIKDENLSRLPEIKDGKEITQRVFREKYGENLLSKEAVDLYYEFYYFSEKSKMDYKIKNGKSTIYNLLNTNDFGLHLYKNHNNGNEYKGLPCAFKTAAINFSVIGKEQTGIVVPYGDAEKIVEQFKASYNPKEKVRKLRELQKYTVSVYSDMLVQLLKEKAIMVIDECFYFLYKTYYDGELGLLLDVKFPFLYYGD